MIQYGIIIICQKTINIINFAREAEFLFIKQGIVKEKDAHLFQHESLTSKMVSEYLENHVWICAHENELGQGVVLWAIWFLCSWDN